VKVCGFGFAPGQTHRLKRPASMLAVVVGLLRAHRKQQAAAWLQWGALWRDLDLVVTDGRATPHNRDRYGGRSTGGLDGAGVRRVVLYALRHTMATLVLRETKDLKLGATQLGHSNEILVVRSTAICCGAWTGRSVAVKNCRQAQTLLADQPKV